MEECHQRLIVGQVEANKRIIELEARVTRLQDELAMQQQKVQARDVPGKEREKMGMGKKLERTLFFPFPFLHFLMTFFFPFLVKIVKNG